MIGASPQPNPKPFHFVTWNNEGTGEYCLWTIIANRKEKETIQFEWYPRLLYPKVRDSSWLEVSSAPREAMLFSKHYISINAGPTYTEKPHLRYPILDKGRR